MIIINCSSFQQLCRMETSVPLMQKSLSEQKEEISQSNAPFLNRQASSTCVRKHVNKKMFSLKQLMTELKEEDTESATRKDMQEEMFL